MFVYIGTGTEERARDKKSRSPHVASVLEKRNCNSVILYDLTGKSDYEVYIAEATAKQLLKGLGHPIIDGETAEVNRSRQREGIENAKRRGVKFGRPTKYVGGFDEAYALVAAGEMTVAAACAKLNISRTQWYRMVKTAS